MKLLNVLTLSDLLNQGISPFFLLFFHLFTAASALDVTLLTRFVPADGFSG